eukprot:1180007-Prorocentrum_minimum.AAC.2
MKLQVQQEAAPAGREEFERLSTDQITFLLFVTTSPKTITIKTITEARILAALVHDPMHKSA